MKRPRTDIEKIVDMLLTIDFQMARYSIADIPEEARQSLLASLRRARIRYDRILGQYATTVTDKAIARRSNHESPVPSL